MTSSEVTVIGKTNPLAHGILWAGLFFCITFIVWANFAILQESTVATATVIPLSRVQVISNMEGGIITQMLVKEGDVVEKDQVLLDLDPTRFISSLNETQARIDRLNIEIDRLNATVQNKPFQPDIDPKNPLHTFILDEISLYKSQLSQVEQLRQNYTLIQKELTMTKPLVSEGAASSVEVLHLQRQLVELQAQTDDFYSHVLTELEAAKGDDAALNASLLAIQDRINRTVIRSPVKGIVRQIRIGSKAGVVMPGAEIMSIVPLGDTLLIEAQVKPSDIGFIHAGENALVKITAYDYSIYGGLLGKVDQVSADTITNEKGENYYLVHIKTQKNYLRTEQNPLYIIPGMTATVNIMTGKRTVFSYLLSPLVNLKGNALRER